MGPASTEQRNRALLDWYAAHRRDLPWREATDPYRVLVSEVMLQQTQAARVAPAYRRFLAAFPTVGALAAATPADVLAAWSGLGYNRRALRLREAARRIAGVGWPTTPDELRELPGVGPYTAAAVACFAFGAQVPAPDANHRRVLGRWRGEALGGRRLWEAAAEELAPGRAQEWNQAVMDLGSAVCRPRPRCESCPVTAWCRGPGDERPPRRPPPFEGSRRQARGRVVRLLVEEGLADRRRLAEATGLDADRLTQALAVLLEEGLVALDRRGRYRLPAS